MELSRDQLIKLLFEASLDRVVKGEEPDPAMSVVAALCRGETIPDAELELILEAHAHGPWVIGSEKDLEVFARWCEASGSPLQLGEYVETEGLRVYRDNFGDCVLAEAARGARYAVWTRKGRLYVGFEVETDATRFREADDLFSLEATGNKLTNLVVVEGGDTPEMIARAGIALALLWLN